MIPGLNATSKDPLEELTKVLAKVAEDIEALSDRVLYAEAALHHIADRIGMSLPGPPEIVTAAPLRSAP